VVNNAVWNALLPGKKGIEEIARQWVSAEGRRSLGPKEEGEESKEKERGEIHFRKGTSYDLIVT